MNKVKLDLNNASVTDKLGAGTTILTATATRADLDPERTSYAAAAHAALAKAEKDLSDARQKVKEIKALRDDFASAHDQTKGCSAPKWKLLPKATKPPSSPLASSSAARPLPLPQ